MEILKSLVQLTSQIQIFLMEEMYYCVYMQDQEGNMEELTCYFSWSCWKNIYFYEYLLPFDSYSSLSSMTS